MPTYRYRLMGPTDRSILDGLPQGVNFVRNPVEPPITVDIFIEPQADEAGDVSAKTWLDDSMKSMNGQEWSYQELVAP